MYILINTPLINSPTGVSNHYLGLKTYFSKNVIYNQYFTYSHLKKNVRVPILNLLIRFISYFYDLIKFIAYLLYYRKPIVLLNPSFANNALKRDVIFLKIAKFFSCKVAIFIHGWDKHYLNKVIQNEELFSPAWKKSDVFFVLAKEFKEILEKLGIEVPIYLTTTKVNDKLMEGVPDKKQIKIVQNLLFLARVEKAKGIFTTIDSFSILYEKYPNIKLRVVGSGDMLKQSKKYAENKNLCNITFNGPLYFEDLRNEFITADLYILPTTHGEGMPTSVLEAMAFGLPVITRPVGGLKDFFENDKMGFMIESLDPTDYAAKIELLINDRSKANKISDYNKQYAKEHFMASKVAKNLEESLKTLI